MIQNRYRPHVKWIERNVPEIANRGPIFVERTIRSAENATRPLPSVIRFVGIFLAIFGGQYVADMFFSYGEQRLEYNIVNVAFIVVGVLVTFRIADHIVNRKIGLIVDRAESDT